MATGNLTLLDIAKLNTGDPSSPLIEENIRFAPEVEKFPFRVIKNTSYRTGIRTGVPTTGFRGANEGQTPIKSEFRQQLHEAFIFGGPIVVDKAVAQADERGVDHVQSIEASGVMMSAMRNIGSQIWYGIAKDAKGFPGVKAALVKGAVTAAGDPLTIDATGTTALTASSVYAVKFGEMDCQLIGGNGKAWDLSEFREQLVTAANGGMLEAYVAGLTGWIGLQIGNENSARRILNVTADSTKGLTDALLARLFATFPIGWTPDAVFYSRRSRAQLQTSRTVTLFGQGTTRPNQENIAPLPTEYDGVPLIATDSILDTDAIE